MKLLAIEHEMADATARQFQQYAVSEARKLWDLYQAGVIREHYFHAERNIAVLVLECASVQEAQEALSVLPFVQNRLITFEIMPLKAYPGLERLFS